MASIIHRYTGATWAHLRGLLLPRILLGQLLLLLALDLAVHWTLLTEFSGYIAWGNFELPFTTSQYPSGPALFWNPFQYGGTPNGLPFSTVTEYVEELGPLTALSILFGVTVGTKLYILMSTFFFGAASLLFARTLVRHPIGQVATAVFLMAGPFNVALYGQGDYIAMVAEGLVFLSLFALWRGINRPSQRWVWLPVSFWLILFTFQAPQAFLLGLLLMACLFPVFFRDWLKSLGLTRNQGRAQRPVSGRAPQPGSNWKRPFLWTIHRRSRRLNFLGDLGTLLARLPALVAIAGIIIIPSYVAFYILGSGASASTSSFAMPISTFTAYSFGPISLLSLNSYFNLSASMVGAGTGSALTLTGWSIVVVMLLILIWVSYLLVRDVRLLYFLLLSVGAALIGAGPVGPLSSLSIFLYDRFPGYAALNASYYWDWFMIAPLYALMLGVLLEGVLWRWSDSSVTVRTIRGSPMPAFRLGTRLLRAARRRPRWATASKGIVIGVIVLISVAVIVPIANGAYYAPPNGIHQVTYPSEYSQIPSLLKGLIGNTYAGVALFNPDVNWFLFNSTQPIPNAFFLYPTVRTPGLPFYGAEPLQSNSYFYWLYDQFYTNSTRYAAELFAIVGVEYFLVFYGTQSASSYPYFLQFSYGKNASQIMNHQVGVVPVIEDKYFAIYRNLDFNGVALSDSNLSLVAGPGYDELNALAYAGVGLSNQSFMFPSDLPSNGCSAVLNRVQRVYAASLNALIGVALQCDHVSVTNPVSDTTPSANPSQAWVPSTRALGVPILDSWPEPLAATFGGPTAISIPLSVNNCTGSCRIWLPVRVGSGGGVLNFGWDGASFTLTTGSGYDGLNNTMIWVQLPFSVTASGQLSITATGGWNAVGSVYVFAVVQGLQITSPVAWLNSNLARATIVQVSPASLVNIAPVTLIGGNLGYLDFPPADTVNSIPGDQGVVASNFGSGPVSISLPMVKPTGSGWIALLVRATGYVYINVTTGNGSQHELIGFDTGDYNGSHNYWGTVMVPWNESQGQLESSLSLSVVKGTLWLAEIWFVPESVPGSRTPTPTIHPVFGPPSVYRSGNVSISNWSTRVTTDGYLSVSVNGTFGPATNFDQFLMNIRLANSATEGMAFAVSANITPGLWVSVNGAVVSYRSQGDFTMFDPLFHSLLSPWENVTFTISSYGDFHGGNNSFKLAARFAFIQLPLAWNVTDFGSGAPLRISADTSGYQLTTNGSGLILVRVSDYPGLGTNGGSSIAPALGTLDTLIWNPLNQTGISVSTNSIGFLYLGIAVSLISTVAWIGVELWVRRIRRGRNHAGSD